MPARTVAGSGKRTARVVVLSVAGTRCAGRLQFPTGGEGQARPRARLLGRAFAEPRLTGPAWSDPAQPAVLNHFRRPLPKRVMPLPRAVCWLRPSILTLGRRRRGNGFRRRAARSKRG